jgi:primosomal protein N'
VALLRVEGLDPDVVDALARRVGDRVRAAAEHLLKSGTWSVLGPAPAPLERLRGHTRHQVFLRARSAAGRGRVLTAVAGDDALARALDRSGCRLVLDVDPMHVL